MMYLKIPTVLKPMFPYDDINEDNIDAALDNLRKQQKVLVENSVPVPNSYIWCIILLWIGCWGTSVGLFIGSTMLFPAILLFIVPVFLLLLLGVVVRYKESVMRYSYSASIAMIANKELVDIMIGSITSLMVYEPLKEQYTKEEFVEKLLGGKLSKDIEDSYKEKKLAVRSMFLTADQMINNSIWRTKRD